MRSLPRLFGLLAVALLWTGCDADAQQSVPAGTPAEPTARPTCAPDDGGITLPDGFCAAVVADGVGRARHLAVDADGDVYVRLRTGGLVALRDTSGDGRADVQRPFFDDGGGTGVRLRDGYLYYSTATAVYRVPLPDGDGLVPTADPEVVVSGFPEQRSHDAKPLAFDDDGSLYVTVGAPSNACQEEQRTAGSPGLNPCPQLEQQASVWRFDADRVGQTLRADGVRYGTGIRHAVALQYDPVSDAVYAVQHGRDQLNQLWPDRYSVEESAELPSEEFIRLREGADFGWPYCYYDHRQGAKVLAPEYGGDGREVGRCADKDAPLVAFPGHYAPNDLLFYTGDQFPDRYRGGAFIAFHGSWNRAPLPQQGYHVAFVPFADGEPAGEPTVFADGFAGIRPIPSAGAAEHRPMALAQGPDGSLYIADSVEGTIWRVVYEGEAP